MPLSLLSAKFTANQTEPRSQPASDSEAQSRWAQTAERPLGPSQLPLSERHWHDASGIGPSQASMGATFTK